jgi:hypothetical protein
MRRALLALIVSAPLLTCVDDALTLHEACMEDTECLGDQKCGRTQEETVSGLPGVCVAKNEDCLVGNQLGCVCDPMGSPDIAMWQCTPQPPRYKEAAPAFFVACDCTTGLCADANVAETCE